MATRIDLSVQKQLRQRQIEMLQSRLAECKASMDELKRQLKECQDSKEQKQIAFRLQKEEKKLLVVKERMLQYGIKVEKRGRPALPPEARADYGKVKLTIRVHQDVVILLDQLKREHIIDSYCQFIEFLVKWYKMQAMQNK